MVGNQEMKFDKKLLKYLPKNRDELLVCLLKHADDMGDFNSVALAYLIRELCPPDRTTKHVFREDNDDD